jgi:hypothetical protein
VAALSLMAGLIVVIVTSPDSIRIGSQSQLPVVTETAAATAPITASADGTQGAASSTVEATGVVAGASPTPVAATVTPFPTFTPRPTDAPAVTPTITPTLFPTLAPDAVAIGVIVTQNNSTARLRSLPGLEGKVIAAVPAGDLVQVLGNATKVDDIAWLPVRLNSGLNGWIADALVVPLTTPKP